MTINLLVLSINENPANNYTPGGNQTWIGWAYGSIASTDTVSWVFSENGTLISTISGTNYAGSSTATFSTTLGYGTVVVGFTASDTTSGWYGGILSPSIFIARQVGPATIKATVTPVASVSSTAYLFGGTVTVNELGSVQSTDSMKVYHSGTAIVGFMFDMNRSISTAGSFQFQTPGTYGASINLLDRIEFGYRGHQSFYGWAYNIDKSSEYVYTITAYDGGYGMAQTANNAMNIPRATAVLSVSGILGSFALQVGGLGASHTERLGLNLLETSIPAIFGWGFSSGQVLQKIESIALGYGFVSYTDYLSNLMLSNYQWLTPGSFSVVVGTIMLAENIDSFVCQSKQFDPSEKYGLWQINGTQANNSTISVPAGGGIPVRTLGDDWLLVQSSDVTQLATIAAQYQQIFENGIWTVQAWSPFWFDICGIDVGGSISSYIGDGKYCFTATPVGGGGQAALIISSLVSGSAIATLNVTGIGSGTYVRNSESPEYCLSTASNGIVEVGKFILNTPTAVGTVGTAGTLAGRSISYDGLNTLYTVGGISGVVYTTDWYTSRSLAVATISGVQTVLAVEPGVAYVGTSAGVVEIGGNTVTGTALYSVIDLVKDSSEQLIYACSSSSVIPYFAYGASTILGLLNVGTFAPGGVIRGTAMQNGLGTMIFAGTNSVVIETGGTFTALVGAVAATVTITDIVFDTAYQQLLITTVNTGSGIGIDIVRWRALNTAGTTWANSGTIIVSSTNAAPAWTTVDSVTRQNLYTLNFADGTTLFNCVITNVQIQQNGVMVTFQSGQTAVGAFQGPPDTTQLSLWNVLATAGT